MKKVLIKIILSLFCIMNVKAQTFLDYISAVRGDTVVVKDYKDMGDHPNSLKNAIQWDTESPAGRVYMLKKGGYYPSLNIVQPNNRELKIIGENNTPIVQSKDTVMLPILCASRS